MAKVTSKGQITIPVSIRRRLSINEGDKILFIDSPDGVVMVNPDMLKAEQGAVNSEQKSDELLNTLPLSSSATVAATPETATPVSAALKEKIASIADTATPVEIAPIEVASAEVATAKVVPAEVATVKVVPAEVAPKIVAPAEVVTAKVAPAEVATAKVAPAEVATVKVAPDPPMTEKSALAEEDVSAVKAKKSSSPPYGFDLGSLLDEIRTIGSKI